MLDYLDLSIVSWFLKDYIHTDFKVESKYHPFTVFYPDITNFVENNFEVLRMHLQLEENSEKMLFLLGMVNFLAVVPCMPTKLPE